MSTELGPIAEQFVTDCQVILGKHYQRDEFESMVRWLSWHIDSISRCSDERMVSLTELQGRHQAQEYIEFIHYVADILNCPHPRYKNKVKEYFAARDQAHIARMEMYCKGAERP